LISLARKYAGTELKYTVMPCNWIFLASSLIQQYTFGPVIASGSVKVSDGGRVLTRTVGWRWFLGGWYGGLLEPAVDTRGKSYAEFVVEDPGEHKEYQGRSCRMGIGATALLEAPDGPSISGGPANISQGWMYYCNDSSIWPEPGLWSARCA
jgi:hypothetical protein